VHIGAVMTRIVQRFTDSGKEVPAKLAEVAAAVSNPALAPAILAKLGVEAGAAIATELFDLPSDAPKPEVKTASAQPLATPALALPEIGGRKDPKPVETADATTKHQDDPSDSTDIALKPAKASDPRAVDPATKPAPLAADARPEPPKPAAPPQPQAQAVQASPPAAAVRVAHAAYQAPQAVQQINLPQIAFEIARHVQQGLSRFEIRLDPPELGRIDVKMDLDTGGALNARLTVERSETLDLLQRDQRQLERALQQAGVDTNKTSLEFSLKQNPFERPQGGSHPAWMAGSDDPALPAAAPEVPPPIQLYRATATAGGVNIFV
jgi:flagellar hook-length control protein FliK